MSVGFGFSIGDLIAGVKLIKTSIQAVSDAKGASGDFAALINEVATLEDGLEAVEELQLEREFSPKQGAAIERAIVGCQNSIDDFCSSIAKYQPHLRNQASGLQTGYRRIKWALCKKEDVANFRAQVARHASSINMLLVTFQIKQNLTLERSRKSSNLTTGSPAGWDQQVAAILSSLSAEQRQCFLYLMQQNKQLVQSIEDLGRMMQVQHAIPPQVLLGQPVVFLDCFGKVAPFHLEFIDSFESFMAVMVVRFKQAGVKPSGVAKLQNHEFSIQDTRRKRFIDITKPWPTVFQPGQKVDMSMVFHRFACPPSTCPACLGRNEGGSEEVYWLVPDSHSCSCVEDPWSRSFLCPVCYIRTILAF